MQQEKDSLDNIINIHKGDKMYFARILPTVDVYELCELSIRTVEDTYIVGVDKHDKRARMFSAKDIGKIVFTNRNKCLETIKNAEKNRKERSFHVEYEEY